MEVLPFVILLITIILFQVEFVDDIMTIPEWISVWYNFNFNGICKYHYYSIHNKYSWKTVRSYGACNIKEHTCPKCKVKLIGFENWHHRNKPPEIISYKNKDSDKRMRILMRLDTIRHNMKVQSIGNSPRSQADKDESSQWMKDENKLYDDLGKLEKNSLFKDCNEFNFNAPENAIYSK